MAVETAQKSEIDTEQPPLVRTRPLQRQIILSSLWQDVEWLHKQIHKRRISHSAHRLNMVRVKAYICSVLLTGLRDHEIDKIMKEIEEIKRHIGMKI